MTTAEPPRILPSHKPGTFATLKCTSCNLKLEFKVPTDIDAYIVECYNCKSSNSKPQPKQQQQSSRGAGGFPGMQAKRGTDASPADLEYYNVLGLNPTATSAEIKKAYYVMAMKYHPDKNKDDPNAEEKFKEISEAYQTLFDPQRRAHYNQYGKAQPGESGGTFMDPEEFFKAQFGGDKFVDYIGEISIGKDFKEAISALNKEGKNAENDSSLSAEDRSKVRQERVAKLADKLISRLTNYSNAFPLPDNELPIGATLEQLGNLAMEQFRIDALIEADILKTENYGVELLNSIGYTYDLKACQYLAHFDAEEGPIYRRLWGYSMKGYGQMKERAHIVSETVGTFRSAIDLQQKFAKLQDLEKKNADPDHTKDVDHNAQEIRARLENEAANKGMETLWRGSKLEVESVLREVCDRLLEDPTASIILRRRRAEALAVLGSVFMAAKNAEVKLAEEKNVPASKSS